MSVGKEKTSTFYPHVKCILDHRVCSALSYVSMQKYITKSMSCVAV